MNRVEQLKEGFKRHKTWLFETKDYFSEYIIEAEKKLDNGIIKPDINCDWSKFNFRYGDNSVLGTLGEMVTVGVWNRNNKYTRCERAPHDMDSEVTGYDVQFVKDGWKYPYMGQVKVAQLGKDVITIKQDWLKYDVRLLHRFILCDVDTDTIFVCDYPLLWAYCTWEGPHIDMNDRKLITKLKGVGFSGKFKYTR